MANFLHVSPLPISNQCCCMQATELDPLLLARFIDMSPLRPLEPTTKFSFFRLERAVA